MDVAFVLLLVLVGAAFRVAQAVTGGVWLGSLALAAWALAALSVVVAGYLPVRTWLHRTARQHEWIIDATSPWLLIACAWATPGFLFSVAGRSETILTPNGGSVALAAILFSSLLGTVAGLLQLTPKHRDRAFRRLRIIGWLGPLVIVASFLVCGMSFFTVITVYFSRAGFVGAADPRQLAVGRIALFYLWHFVSLLPLGKVPDTLRWAPPLTYVDPAIGRRVLAFQALTVTTTLATLRAYWTFRQSALVRLEFGSTHVWDDGVTVKVGSPSTFEPRESSAADGASSHVVFTVTIVNHSARTVDLSRTLLTLQSDHRHAPQVFDRDQDVAEVPATELPPGGKSKRRVGFGVTNANDLSLEVSLRDNHVRPTVVYSRRTA